jgi:hypothetical protein
MPLIHFQPQFAPSVAAGIKRQTIRATRKRPLKRGDRLIFGTWQGAPYRSKVRRLGESICMDVVPIEIFETGQIRLNGRVASCKRRGAIALADGFSCGQEMLQWFDKNHGLPFRGVLIRWGSLLERTAKNGT